MTRIFREAHERALPPEGRDVLWLRPCEGSYTAMVYKPEDGRWISLNRTSWSDLLDVPGPFRDEETLREHVKEIVKGALSEAATPMADEVAYRYGGDVGPVKALPGELEKDGESLPSVASVLSLLIAKAWFKPLSVTLTGKTEDLFIGDEAGAREVAFAVSNLIPGEGASITTSVSDDAMSMKVEGGLSGSITLGAFTPSARKPYGVTVTAVCADADGEPGAQTVSMTSACAAWWPVWAWCTGGEAGVESRRERKLLKGDIATRYINGTFYYHLLAPSPIKEATQGLKGDWTNNYRLVSTGEVSICGRDYYYYRSPSPVTSKEAKPLDLSITLTSIN